MPIYFLLSFNQIYQMRHKLSKWKKGQPHLLSSYTYMQIFIGKLKMDNIQTSYISM